MKSIEDGIYTFDMFGKEMEQLRLDSWLDQLDLWEKELKMGLNSKDERDKKKIDAIEDKIKNLRAMARSGRNENGLERILPGISQIARSKNHNLFVQIEDGVATFRFVRANTVEEVKKIIKNKEEHIKFQTPILDKWGRGVSQHVKSHNVESLILDRTGKVMSVSSTALWIKEIANLLQNADFTVTNNPDEDRKNPEFKKQTKDIARQVNRIQNKGLAMMQNISATRAKNIKQNSDLGEARENYSEIAQFFSGLKFSTVALMNQIWEKNKNNYSFLNKYGKAARYKEAQDVVNFERDFNEVIRWAIMYSTQEKRAILEGKKNVASGKENYKKALLARQAQFTKEALTEFEGIYDAIYKADPTYGMFSEGHPGVLSLTKVDSPMSRFIQDANRKPKQDLLTLIDQRRRTFDNKYTKEVSVWENKNIKKIQKTHLKGKNKGKSYWVNEKTKEKRHGWAVKNPFWEVTDLLDDSNKASRREEELLNMEKKTQQEIRRRLEEGEEVYADQALYYKGRVTQQHLTNAIGKFFETKGLGKYWNEEKGRLIISGNSDEDKQAKAKWKTLVADYPELNNYTKGLTLEQGIARAEVMADMISSVPIYKVIKAQDYELEIDNVREKFEKLKEKAKEINKDYEEEKEKKEKEKEGWGNLRDFDSEGVDAEIANINTYLQKQNKKYLHRKRQLRKSYYMSDEEFKKLEEGKLTEEDEEKIINNIVAHRILADEMPPGAKIKNVRKTDDNELYVDILQKLNKRYQVKELGEYGPGVRENVVAMHSEIFDLMLDEAYKDKVDRLRQEKGDEVAERFKAAYKRISYVSQAPKANKNIKIKEIPNYFWEALYFLGAEAIFQGKDDDFIYKSLKPWLNKQVDEKGVKLVLKSFDEETDDNENIKAAIDNFNKVAKELGYGDNFLFQEGSEKNTWKINDWIGATKLAQGSNERPSVPHKIKRGQKEIDSLDALFTITGVDTTGVINDLNKLRSLQNGVEANFYDTQLANLFNLAFMGAQEKSVEAMNQIDLSEFADFTESEKLSTESYLRGGGVVMSKEDAAKNASVKVARKILKDLGEKFEDFNKNGFDNSEKNKDYLEFILKQVYGIGLGKYITEDLNGKIGTEGYGIGSVLPIITDIDFLKDVKKMDDTIEALEAEEKKLREQEAKFQIGLTLAKSDPLKFKKKEENTNKIQEATRDLNLSIEPLTANLEKTKKALEENRKKQLKKFKIKYSETQRLTDSLIVRVNKINSRTDLTNIERMEYTGSMVKRYMDNMREAIAEDEGEIYEKYNKILITGSEMEKSGSLNPDIDYDYEMGDKNWVKLTLAQISELTKQDKNKEKIDADVKGYLNTLEESLLIYGKENKEKGSAYAKQYDKLRENFTKNYNTGALRALLNHMAKRATRGSQYEIEGALAWLLLNRYPSITGMDVMAAKGKLVAGNTNRDYITLNPYLQRILNADNDGDIIAIAALSALNGNKKSLDALYEYTKNAKEMSKAILSEDLGRLEGTYDAQFDEFIKEHPYVASQVQEGKNAVGGFSDLNYAMKQILNKQGLGLGSILKTGEEGIYLADPENTSHIRSVLGGRLLTGFLATLEQDAISAKKIGDKIKNKTGIDAEFSVVDLIEGIKTAQEKILSGSNWKSKEAFKTVIEESIGLLGADSLINKRMLAMIAAEAKTIGGNYWDTFGEIISGEKGKRSEEIIQMIKEGTAINADKLTDLLYNEVYGINTKLGQSMGESIDLQQSVDTRYNFIGGKGKAASRWSKHTLFDYMSEEDKKLFEDLPSLQRDLELARKNAIAEQQIKYNTYRSLINWYNDNTTGFRAQMDEIYEMAESETDKFKSLESPHTILSKYTPNKYDKGLAPEVTEKIWDELNKNIGSDFIPIQNWEALGNDLKYTEDIMNKFYSTELSLLTGNYAHLENEIQFLEQRDKNTKDNLEEQQKIKEEITKKTKEMSNIEEALKKLVATRQKEGLEELSKKENEELNRETDEAKKINIRDKYKKLVEIKNRAATNIFPISDAIKNMLNSGDLKGETIGTEVILAGFMGDNSVGGVADLLKFDEETGQLTIGDIKTNAGAITPQNMLQIAMYGLFAKELQEDIKHLTKGKNNIGSFEAYLGMSDKSALARKYKSQIDHQAKIAYKNALKQETLDEKYRKGTEEENEELFIEDFRQKVYEDMNRKGSIFDIAKTGSIKSIVGAILQASSSGTYGISTFDIFGSKGAPMEGALNALMANQYLTSEMETELKGLLSSYGMKKMEGYQEDPNSIINKIKNLSDNGKESFETYKKTQKALNKLYQEQLKLTLDLQELSYNGKFGSDKYDAIEKEKKAIDEKIEELKGKQEKFKIEGLSSSENAQAKTYVEEELQFDEDLSLSSLKLTARQNSILSQAEKSIKSSLGKTYLAIIGKQKEVYELQASEKAKGAITKEEEVALEEAQTQLELLNNQYKQLLENLGEISTDETSKAVNKAKADQKAKELEEAIKDLETTFNENKELSNKKEQVKTMQEWQQQFQSITDLEFEVKNLKKLYDKEQNENKKIQIANQIAYKETMKEYGESQLEDYKRKKQHKEDGKWVWNSDWERKQYEQAIRGRDAYYRIKEEEFLKKGDMRIQNTGVLGNGIPYQMSSYFQRMFQGGVLAASISKYIQEIKKLINITKELDKVMTNVRIVTGDSATETRNLISQYTQLSKELGVTTGEVARSGVEWLRQGYNIAETNKLITASLYLSKLGMMDSASATRSLTSALKGFKLEASQAMDIVDKLTALDLKAATSAGDIAQGLSQFANLGSLSGVDIDQAAAYVATITDVTQMSGSSAGQALKTILSRYGNVKAGAYGKINVDSENSDVGESLNDVERILGKIGISIRDTNLKFKDFDVVLAEIADKWNVLDNVSKKAIASAFAGTRQQESFITLLENWDKYEELLEVSQNSKGTAEIKYTSYKESLEASMNEVKTAFEGLANNGEIVEVLKFLNKQITFLTEDIFPKFIKWFPQILGFIENLRIKNGNSFFQRLLGKESVKEWLSGWKMTDQTKGDIEALGGRGKFTARKAIFWKQLLGDTGKGKYAKDDLENLHNEAEAHIEAEKSKEEELRRQRIERRKIEKAYKDYGRLKKKENDKYTSEIGQIEGKEEDLNESEKSAINIIDEQIKKYRHKNARTKNKKRKKENKIEELQDKRKDIIKQASKRKRQEEYDAKIAEYRKKQSEAKITLEKKKQEQSQQNILQNKRKEVKEEENITQQANEQERSSEKELQNTKAEKQVKASKTSEENKKKQEDLKKRLQEKYNKNKPQKESLDDIGAALSFGVNTVMRSVSAYLTSGTSHRDAYGNTVASSDLAHQVDRTIAAIPLLGNFYTAFSDITGLSFGRWIDKERDEANHQTEVANKRLETLSSTQDNLMRIRNLANATSPEDIKERDQAVTDYIDSMYSSENSDLREMLEHHLVSIGKKMGLELGESTTLNGLMKQYQEGDKETKDKISRMLLIAQERQKREDTMQSKAAERYALENQLNEKRLKYQSTLDGYNGLGISNGELATSIAGGSGAGALTLGGTVAAAALLGLIGGPLTAIAIGTGLAVGGLVGAGTGKAIAEGYQENYKENTVLINDKIDLLINEEKRIRDQIADSTRDQTKELSERLEALKDYRASYEALREWQNIQLKEYNKSVLKEGILSTAINNQYITDLTSGQLNRLSGPKALYKAIGDQIGSQLMGVRVTDSMGNLSQEYIDLLTPLLKEDEEIAQYLRGDNYTLSEAWGKFKDSEDQFDIERLKNFANVFSTTTEGLTEYIQKFGNLKLGELLQNSSELSDTINNYSSLLSNINDKTQSVSKWMGEIIKQFPELMPYMDNTSLLTEKILEKVISLNSISNRTRWSELADSDEYFKNTISPNMLASIEDESARKQVEELIAEKNFQNMNDVVNYISSQGGKTAIENGSDETNKNLLKAFLQGANGQTLTSDAYKAVVDTYINKNLTLMDKQLDNLNKQKEALQNINHQREYENKLIEARNRLENAQKEKRRIYRAGVGWVYEADQSKIEEAQENLKEVEKEKDISIIEKQIDLLSSLREEWANINTPTIAELQDYINTFNEKFGIDATGAAQLLQVSDAADGLKESIDALTLAILEEKDKVVNKEGQAVLEAYENYIKNTGKGLETNDYLQLFFNAAKNAVDSGIDLTKIGEGTKISDLYKEGYEKNKENISEYFEIETQSGKKSLLKTDGSQITDENASFILKDLKNAAPIKNPDKAAKKQGEAILIKSDGTQEKISINALNNKAKITNMEEYGSLKDYTNALFGSGELGDYNGIVFLGSNGKVEYGYATRSGGLFGMDTARLEERVDSFKGPIVVYGWAGEKNEYQANDNIFIDRTNGKLYRKNGDKYEYSGAYLNDKNELLYESMNSHPWFNLFKEDDSGKAIEYQSNKLGALDLQSSGLNLINEYGPEALVTPQGTLTALPAHTGIIPADITKNLWSLGELAPSILSALQMNIPTHVPITGFTGGGLDESLNISNLTMHVNSSGTFDAKQFVQSLKEQAALTRNK